MKPAGKSASIPAEFPIGSYFRRKILSKKCYLGMLPGDVPAAFKSAGNFV